MTLEGRCRVRVRDVSLSTLQASLSSQCAVQQGGGTAAWWLTLCMRARALRVRGECMGQSSSQEAKTQGKSRRHAGLRPHQPPQPPSPPRQEMFVATCEQLDNLGEAPGAFPTGGSAPNGRGAGRPGRGARAGGEEGPPPSQRQQELVSELLAGTRQLFMLLQGGPEGREAGARVTRMLQASGGGRVVLVLMLVVVGGGGVGGWVDCGVDRPEWASRPRREPQAQGAAPGRHPRVALLGQARSTKQNCCGIAGTGKWPTAKPARPALREKAWRAAHMLCVLRACSPRALRGWRTCWGRWWRGTRATACSCSQPQTPPAGWSWWVL